VPAPTLFWRGDFLGEGSLARVNRCLAAALLAEGVRVVPWGEPTTAIEQKLGLEPQPIEAAAPDGEPVLTLRHRWPPEFLRPARGPYVHMQPWEYGAIPARWIDGVAAGADDVWCYSTFVRDRYLESGIRADRVHVVPLGYDPAIYDPAVEPMPVDLPNDTCLFLFCSGLTPRKNLASAVAAYAQAFSPRDRVALLVKDNSAMAAYARDTTAEEMKALAARTDIAPVRYVDANLDDHGMARLYRASAALLHPSKGEGFGLPVLEAMGCGTPAIVAAGTASDDFVDDATAYRVASRRVELGRVVNGLELASEGWWMEPEVDALAEAMRGVYRDREAAAARGRVAAARARSGWTWTHAGRAAA
jgi:glycosyltransferase involved in cell wall biosynthesis